MIIGIKQNYNSEEKNCNNIMPILTWIYLWMYLNNEHMSILTNIGGLISNTLQSLIDWSFALFFNRLL